MVVRVFLAVADCLSGRLLFYFSVADSLTGHYVVPTNAAASIQRNQSVQRAGSVKGG